jgi:hypothetical protein
MNKLTFITLLIAISSAAVAESPTIIDETSFTSTKTRAEVQAELFAFKRGANPWSTSYNQFAGMQVATSRDAVREELLAARRQGALGAMHGEDSGSLFLAQQQSVPSTVYATTTQPVR